MNNDPKSTGDRDKAEALGLLALRFLAADEQRLGRFLALTGTAPGDLREAIDNPAFLGGVLDHLLQDETLLHIFCAENGVAPSQPGALRPALPGGETVTL